MSFCRARASTGWYLNVYVPQLQRIGGVVWYLRGHLGQRFASTAGVAPKTEAFVARVERFVADQGVEITPAEGADRRALCIDRGCGAEDGSIRGRD